MEILAETLEGIRWVGGIDRSRFGFLKRKLQILMMSLNYSYQSYQCKDGGW